MARNERAGRRLRAGLPITGLTLGILLLFFLQFAIPYWIGPVGLVVVGFIDAAIYLELRRRRAARRRARTRRIAAPGAVNERRGPVKDEFAATLALFVLLLGIFVEGASFQGHVSSVGMSVLFLIGAVLVMIACLMLRPYEWNFYRLRPASEEYDTTDDH